MTRLRIVLVAAVAALTAAGIAVAVPGGNFSVHATGALEVPVRDTGAQGQATFKLSKDGESLSYKLNVANIENVIMAHIHQGVPGVAGDIVVWLYPSTAPGVLAPAGGGRISGRIASGTITADDLVGPLGRCGSLRPGRASPVRRGVRERPHERRRRRPEYRPRRLPRRGDPRELLADRPTLSSRGGFRAAPPGSSRVGARLTGGGAQEARPLRHRRPAGRRPGARARARTPAGAALPRRARRLRGGDDRVPVGHACLPVVDRDRGMAGRARDPAPRLVRPRGGTDRRVRLLAGRRGGRRGARNGSRLGAQPVRRPICRPT